MPDASKNEDQKKFTEFCLSTDSLFADYDTRVILMLRSGTGVQPTMAFVKGDSFKIAAAIATLLKQEPSIARAMIAFMELQEAEKKGKRCLN